ncbi:hypothetical protein AV530_006098 [Patagioenas fasciata monilis]|uniref:Uncharacterized protein n=1 Tax=Patagioenas fasciata monilis TaxID=372326 RepID=A0A1V4J866_PATFA|nr:hypothetical protein AV530_006098 [Patagioenas fasciata monilis]
MLIIRKGLRLIITEGCTFVKLCPKNGLYTQETPGGQGASSLSGHSVPGRTLRQAELLCQAAFASAMPAQRGSQAKLQ